MDNQAYYKSIGSPSQDRRSSDVKSPQLVLNILRSKSDYQTDKGVINNKPSSLVDNIYCVNSKDQISSKQSSSWPKHSSIEVSASLYLDQ